MTMTVADKVVYLERPGYQSAYYAQPVFNPQTVNADVNEQIHFVARFGDQRPYHTSV
jgi:hypothetical protein